MEVFKYLELTSHDSHDHKQNFRKIVVSCAFWYYKCLKYVQKYIFDVFLIKYQYVKINVIQINI